MVADFSNSCRHFDVTCNRGKFPYPVDTFLCDAVHPKTYLLTHPCTASDVADALEDDIHFLTVANDQHHKKALKMKEKLDDFIRAAREEESRLTILQNEIAAVENRIKACYNLFLDLKMV
jgi:hypothetical protein